MSNKNDYNDFKQPMDYKYPTSSKTSPNRKSSSSKYDGVEYTPSNNQAGNKPTGNKSYGNTGGSQPKRTGTGISGKPIGTTKSSKSYQSSAAKPRVKSSSQSNMFMIITVAIGIAICLGAFFLMFQLTKPKVVKQSDEITLDSSNITETGTSAEDLDSGAAALTESDSETAGVIKFISSSTLTIVDADTDKSLECYVSGTTGFKDKYGNLISLSQLSEGDIVIASYNSTNKKAQEIRLDPEAWTKQSVKNIEITSGQSETVKIGNDNYIVSSMVVMLPEGTSPGVKQSDVVTLMGRKNKILTVFVEKRSGELEFVNKDKIIDGTVEVDSDIYKALDEITTLKVLEGNHQVVIKGSNIDVFIKDITIKAGETVTIDLSEAPSKEGVINLSVNVSDYVVAINNETIADSNTPIKLPFGDYKIKVMKDGYVPWEGNVTVNTTAVNVTANLTQEVKTGRISVTVEPVTANASVYIDNALIGNAPVKAQVTYGDHQLTVKAHGYLDASTAIIVEGDNGYNVILQPSANDNSAATDTTTQTDTTQTTDNETDVQY